MAYEEDYTGNGGADVDYQDQLEAELTDTLTKPGLLGTR